MEEAKIRKVDAIVIGGSAGSLELILSIVGALPASTRTTIIIIVHRKNDSESLLEDLIKSRTSLRVREVEDKDPLRPSTIYIAPPDYHLLFESRKEFSLDMTAKVQYSRPSIDVSFESAASVFKDSLAGLLLSGANADGTAGLISIASNGGLVLVQDPSTAEVDYMPQHALSNAKVDFVVAANDLPAFIVSICN